MKRIIILSVLFLGAALGDAMAQCRGTRVADVQTALESKFVCAARTNGTDTWSEEHGILSGGGILTEYAKGPGNAVDPRKPVGSWTVTGNNSATAVVQYTYTGDSNSPYNWSLFFVTSNSYLFCSADGNTAIATANITPLVSGQGFPCSVRK